MKRDESLRLNVVGVNRHSPAHFPRVQLGVHAHGDPAHDETQRQAEDDVGQRHRAPRAGQSARERAVPTAHKPPRGCSQERGEIPDAFASSQRRRLRRVLSVYRTLHVVVHLVVGLAREGGDRGPTGATFLRGI